VTDRAGRADPDSRAGDDAETQNGQGDTVATVFGIEVARGCRVAPDCSRDPADECR
jgi:hypothetical protein